MHLFTGVLVYTIVLSIYIVRFRSMFTFISTITGTLQREKPRFRMNRPKLFGNCAFPQNVYTRKLGKIAIFFAMKRSIALKRSYVFHEHHFAKNIKLFDNISEPTI